MASIIHFGFTLAMVLFVVLNGLLHFVTDYWTSKWSSFYFAKAIDDTRIVINYKNERGYMPPEEDMKIMHVNPGAHWHNFFVIIGLDQMLHHAAIGFTLFYVFYATY